MSAISPPAALQEARAAHAERWKSERVQQKAAARLAAGAVAAAVAAAGRRVASLVRRFLSNRAVLAVLLLVSLPALYKGYRTLHNRQFNSRDAPDARCGGGARSCCAVLACAGPVHC